MIIAIDFETPLLINQFTGCEAMMLINKAKKKGVKILEESFIPPMIIKIDAHRNKELVGFDFLIASIID